MAWRTEVFGEMTAAATGSATRVAPSVSVVICTRNRLELLTAAVAAAVSQEYEGWVEVIIVFDQSQPVPSLAMSSADREVRVLMNDRTPGLAGARNTGIEAARGDLVAFCDDDDAWLPGKLARQVEAMARHGAIGAAAGIEIHFGNVVRERVPAVERIDVSNLARERVTGAHPSTFVWRRDVLVERVGLVDEELPYGYGEDYDLLLRAARLGTVVMVQAPLVRVLWHRESYFAQRWEAMAAGIGYLLEKHPEIRNHRQGRAWMEGQRAFAFAAMGERRAALRSAGRSLRSDAREPRAYVAVLVVLRLVKASTVLRWLNARGRGV